MLHPPATSAAAAAAASTVRLTWPNKQAANVERASPARARAQTHARTRRTHRALSLLITIPQATRTCASRATSTWWPSASCPRLAAATRRRAPWPRRCRTRSPAPSSAWAAPSAAAPPTDDSSTSTTALCCRLYDVPADASRPYVVRRRVSLVAWRSSLSAACLEMLPAARLQCAGHTGDARRSPFRRVHISRRLPETSTPLPPFSYTL